MDLATWRKRNPRGALAALADKTGLRWQTLYAIAKGDQKPSVRSAQLIESGTDGKVTAVELLGLKPKRAKGAA